MSLRILPCRLSWLRASREKMPARPQLRRNSGKGNREQIVAVPMSRFLLSACLAVSFLVPAIAEAGDRPKQLVIISFDGAHDNALWLKSREMAAKNGAHFTYFLSCTFLMNEAAKKAYQAPHQKRGKSNVGFAQSDDEIRERLGNIWHAHLEGHDISSHACGHFDGRQWSEADWSAEYAAFHETLKNAWKSVNLAEPAGWQDLVDHGI